MTINRNQYFVIGLVLLVLGLQFRAVDAYVLNEECSKLMSKDPQVTEQPTGFLSPMVDEVPVPERTFRLPRWLGWALLSIGGVLILHSLAMRRPT